MPSSRSWPAEGRRSRESGDAAGSPGAKHAVVRCGRRVSRHELLSWQPCRPRAKRRGFRASPRQRQVVHTPYAVHKPPQYGCAICYSSHYATKRRRTAIVSRMIGSKGRDSTIRMASFRGWLPGAKQKSERPAYTLPLLLPITVPCLPGMRGHVPCLPGMRGAVDSSLAFPSGGVLHGNCPRGRAPGAGAPRPRLAGMQTTLPC